MRSIGLHGPNSGLCHPHWVSGSAVHGAAWGRGSARPAELTRPWAPCQPCHPQERAQEAQLCGAYAIPTAREQYCLAVPCRPVARALHQSLSRRGWHTTEPGQCTACTCWRKHHRVPSVQAAHAPSHSKLSCGCLGLGHTRGGLRVRLQL
eukprot:3281461-Amphidinium_carterae.3